MPAHKEQPGTTLRAARDFIVLCLLMAGVNYLLARKDPGWMELNPTPWLLPVALMGVRYGFAAGMVSGVLVAGGIAACQIHLLGKVPAPLLHDEAFFFLALVLVGVVAGQAGSMRLRRHATLARTTARLQEENARVRAQLQIVDETRQQLQQQLALWNAPLGSLDEELARLFTFPQQEFAHQLLVTLHQLTHITSAGIYTVQGGMLEQVAAIHPTGPLQPRLSLGAVPMAAEALNSRSLASVTDATELTQAQPFLAAFPWLDHLGRTSVLLIQDMPLESYNLRNLARLELILSWSSALAALRHTFTASAGADHTVSGQEFQILLEEAINADRVHRLPSALVLVKHEGHQAGALLKLLPAAAVATRMGTSGTLAVLLPFSGATEGSQLARQVAASLPGVRTSHYVITGDVSTDSVWQSLQQA